MDLTPTQTEAPVESHRGLSRRSVVRAGAWTAPTVVAVMAVPEAANASDGTSPTAVWAVTQDTLAGANLSGRSDDGTAIAASGSTNASYQVLYFTVEKRGGPDFTSVAMAVNLRAAGNGATYSATNSALGGWAAGTGTTGTGVKSFNFAYGPLSGSAASPGTTSLKVVIGAASGGAAAETVANTDYTASVVFTASDATTRTFSLASGVSPAGNVSGPSPANP